MKSYRLAVVTGRASGGRACAGEANPPTAEVDARLGLNPWTPASGSRVRTGLRRDPARVSGGVRNFGPPSRLLRARLPLEPLRPERGPAPQQQRRDGHGREKGFVQVWREPRLGRRDGEAGVVLVPCDLRLDPG